jgi:20S proteasome alpha/beta subunit
MVGTDGIVLASDTRYTHTKSIWHTSNSSKITINRERGIAIASSRNMELSLIIARAVITELTDEELKSPEIPIEKIAQRIVNQSREQRRDVQCIVVISNPIPQLFYLQMTEVDGSWAPLCMREGGKAVAGDTLNAAVFFTERYYERRPVGELIPLAAHLIFAGHTLNSYGIDGLEIIVCDSTGFHPVPMNSILRLQSRAAALDATISSSLFQFEEVGDTPDVVG